MNILSFHESSVTSFSIQENTFVLGLDGVSTDCSVERVKISLEELTKVLVDSVQIFDRPLNMPCSDGEILTLELGEKKVFILIEWNDFSSGISFTQSYEMDGGILRVEAET